MARRAEDTFWILVKQGDKCQYVSVSKVGSGRYVSNIEGPLEPGPYYLRYTQDGKRKWECVGPELALALNEQCNLQTALDRGKPSEQAEDLKSLSRSIESYLSEVRTRRSEKAAKRTRWLLELFASATKKHYLDEITRNTLFLFIAYLADVLFDGMMRRGQSDSRQRPRPVGSAAECDGLEDPPFVRTIDSASRRVSGLRGRAGDKPRAQASTVGAWRGSLSKRHLDVLKELPYLRFWKTNDQPSEARQ